MKEIRVYSKTTQDEFLAFIRNYYDGANTLGSITDANEMLDFANEHQLSAIYYYMLLQHKENIPYDARELMRTYLANIQLNATLGNESRKLDAYLKAENIPHSYFKGQYIKRYYTPSEIRSMGDADIYVPQEYMDKVKAYLEGEGYEITNYYAGVTSFDKGKAEFEVHNAIDWFGVDFAEGEELGEDGFDLNTEVRLTIVHAMKHIAEFGCGIRQVLDIALMLREDDSCLSDKEYLAKIESLTLTTCFETLLGVVDKWFGTSYAHDAKSESVDILADAILDGGVFGTNLNDYATINTVKNKNKASMIWHMLFPTYERMTASYPVLKTKKYLLPWYYMVRLFTRGLKEKRYKVIHADNVDKNSIESRQKFVDALALDKQYYAKIR